MKKWTGFIITLAVLILFAYYLMGFMVERTLNKNIKAIPKNPVLNVALDKYHRGWFFSQAQIVIKMHIPEQVSTDKNGVSKNSPPIDFAMNVPLRITHGPIIFTGNGVHFGLGYVTTKPESHYNLLLSYFNKTIVHYSLPSFTMSSKSTTEEGTFNFNWQGLKALLAISPDVDTINGYWVLFGFNGEANKVTFSLGNLMNKFKFAYNPIGLWLGHNRLSLASAKASIEGQKTFELEQFNLHLGTDITNEVYNLTSKLSLKKLMITGKNYGPGTIKLSINNIDPKVMAHISQLQTQIIQNNQNPTLNKLALLAELPKLLTKNSSLELSECSINMPEGTLSGHFKVALHKTNVSDPAQLLQQVYSSGQFKAPITLVRTLLVTIITSNLNKQAQIASQQSTSTTTSVIPVTPTTNDYTSDAQSQTDKIIQKLVDKGLLLVDGTDYAVSFTYEQQLLLVNGHPFTPDLLQ